MFIRGCLFTLSVLALAGNAKHLPAQNAALQVEVYDYAGLNPAALHEFVRHTQQILTNSGLAAEAALCTDVVSISCEGREVSSKRVVIRVVPGSPTDGKISRGQPLGHAYAGHDGGKYASVFLNVAEEKAGEVNLTPIDLLAYAAVHEIGHLLLGNHAHTARGLMKADWAEDEFQAMAQNRLYFIPEQAKELRIRYGLVKKSRPNSGITLADRR